jgi:G3E family GTPase
MAEAPISGAAYRRDAVSNNGATHATPVSIVTGFLGSGKTTFIRRILSDPEFGSTAVIVNEFGEISLDHDLIASSDDSIVTLSTGCLCCAVQTDLGRTLKELMDRRLRGEIAYQRVLIETSGLAEPGRMLQAVMTDASIAALHRIDTIVTLVDALHGGEALQHHATARNQVAVADVVLASKTDLVPLSDTLRKTVAQLNTLVGIQTTGCATADMLFGRQEAKNFDVLEAGGGLTIESVTLRRSDPVPALALTMFLQGLAEHSGSRLLRLKGLVSLEELPGQPALIHGVHHVMSAPEILDRWPTNDETTRIVIIGDGIPRYFADRLLDAVIEDVRTASVTGYSA